MYSSASFPSGSSSSQYGTVPANTYQASPYGSGPNVPLSSSGDYSTPDPRYCSTNPYAAPQGAQLTTSGTYSGTGYGQYPTQPQYPGTQQYSGAPYGNYESGYPHPPAYTSGYSSPGYAAPTQNYTSYEKPGVPGSGYASTTAQVYPSNPTQSYAMPPPTQAPPSVPVSAPRGPGMTQSAPTASCEIDQWLDSVGFSQYKQLFASEKVTFDTLRSLTEKDFVALSNALFVFT